MADACLFVMMARKILWINVGELLALGKEEVVDWESLSPPPFFIENVPDVQVYRETYHHFVFDSEIYVGVGGLFCPYEINVHLDGYGLPYVPGKGFRRGTYDDIQESLSKMPSCKIYRFDVERREFTVADPIPPPPPPFAPCFMGNISASGDVYCLVCYGSGLPATEGLWVLSSSRKWQPLSPPPPLGLKGYGSELCRCFVFQDKLFLHVDREGAEPSMHFFDPTTSAWTPLDKHAMDSFMPYFDSGFGKFCAPRVTIPRLSSCSVVLSWSFPVAPGDFLVAVKIDALLVNNQNGVVILRQSLDDCLEGIRPATFNAFCSSFSFVDLGNGKVCALLFGYSSNHQYPVLCISVFTLTVIEANIDIDIDIDTETGTEPPRKDQSFLSVSVLVKRVFAMKGHECSWMLDPSIFTPKKELPLALKGTHAPLHT